MQTIGPAIGKTQDKNNHRGRADPSKVLTATMVAQIGRINSESKNGMRTIKIIMSGPLGIPNAKRGAIVVIFYVYSEHGHLSELILEAVAESLFERVHFGRVPFFNLFAYESSSLHRFMMMVSSIGEPIVQ